MSSKLKKRETKPWEELVQILRYVHQIEIWVLLFAVLCILPLYHRGLFNQISEEKFLFYKTISLFFFACLLFTTLMSIVYTWVHKEKTTTKAMDHKRWLSDLSCTDVFVLAYLIVTFVSFLIQDWEPSFALWGYPRWRMGLMSQVFFGLTYYYVSRYFVLRESTPKTTRPKTEAYRNNAQQTNRTMDNKYTLSAVYLFVAMLLVAFAVIALGVLHLFSFFLLGLQEGVTEGRSFALSTIGNPNRYSQFVALMLPFGFFCYTYAKRVYQRILAGVYLMVAFVGAVTQNSDSCFVALFALFLVWFWFSFASNLCMKRFLEIVLLMLLSFKTVGILQRIMPQRIERLDALPAFLSQSRMTWVVLALCVLAYILYSKWDKEGKREVCNARPYRNKGYLVLGILFVLMIVYIVLNSVELLPASLRTGGYFYVDDAWGSDRGFNWRIAVMTFLELPPLQKVFGAGPYSFYAASQAYFADEIWAFYEGEVLVIDAHNEWLSAFVNGGILGGIAYVGIFVSAFKRFARNVAKEPFLLALCGCIAAYAANNVFAFQSINVTPAMFVFLGVGESVMRARE